MNYLNVDTETIKRKNLNKSELFNQPFLILMQICGILYELEEIGLMALFILFTIIIL